MLFKNLRHLAEIKEDEDDIYYEETEEDEYEREEIKSAITELSDAVATMKELVLNVLENEASEEKKEDERAISQVTEIYRSHLKINWDEAHTHDVLPTLRSFERIQQHLKEINYSFVHLEVSEYRYSILRNICVSKLTYLLERILYKVY
ncbi:hypothetical protein NEF87_000688 [Candidatus Lokiarchaeum ossiferum]|uniref:Uncharacterized protein n=1 Tax=Candidatus Lokiarchaeum ossiferum TaxID=2951803 RepID=A0ABY6HM72_9ARCH|nr:hypothetical protein NEF87_000688 [Candidatus Lokiarchaeum sp. B-35]